MIHGLIMRLAILWLVVAYVVHAVDSPLDQPTITPPSSTGGSSPSTTETSPSSTPPDPCETEIPDPLWTNHHAKMKPKVNQALMCVNSSLDFNVSVYVVSDECQKCEPYLLGVVRQNSHMADLIVNTTFPTRFRLQHFFSKYNETVHHCEKQFEDSGEYVMIVKPDPTVGWMCDIYTNVYPPSPLIPIWVTLAVLVAMALLYELAVYVYHTPLLYRCCFCLETDRLVNSELGTPRNPGEADVTPLVTSPTKKIRRLRSLDTFRGISIVLMIFVNYGGGKYWFFKHAAWNGLTFADLVFPWFIFIMGVSILLSMSAQQRQGLSKKQIFYKIIKRSVILFCLGLFLNSHYKNMGGDLTKLRIPGVLQRFSISYLVVASVELIFLKQTDQHQFVWWSPVRDITDNCVQFIIMCLALILHILITLYVTVPSCPRGYLGPGGIADMATHPNCTGGVAGYIDRLVLGVNHIYQTPTTSKVYFTSQAYDPEGILGLLTSIFLTFLGVQASRILIVYHQWKNRIIRWLLWAMLIGSVGTLLCKASQDSGWIPVNKNLWSASFVCVTGALGFILLSVCYYLCDVLAWWGGGPFYFAGMNSILLYCGHEILKDYFPFYWYGGESHTAYLSCAVSGTLCWVLIAYYCFRISFFLKV